MKVSRAATVALTKSAAPPAPLPPLPFKYTPSWQDQNVAKRAQIMLWEGEIARLQYFGTCCSTAPPVPRDARKTVKTFWNKLVDEGKPTKLEELTAECCEAVERRLNPAEEQALKEAVEDMRVKQARKLNVLRRVYDETDWGQMASNDINKSETRRTVVAAALDIRKEIEEAQKITEESLVVTKPGWFDAPEPKISISFPGFDNVSKKAEKAMETAMQKAEEAAVSDNTARKVAAELRYLPKDVQELEHDLSTNHASRLLQLQQKATSMQKEVGAAALPEDVATFFNNAADDLEATYREFNRARLGWVIEGDKTEVETMLGQQIRLLKWQAEYRGEQFAAAARAKVSKTLLEGDMSAADEAAKVAKRIERSVFAAQDYVGQVEAKAAMSVEELL